MIAAFAFNMFATRWPDICYTPEYAAPLRIVGDLCTLLPYGLGILAIWWLTYPVDRALRQGLSRIEGDEGATRPVWSRRQYLTFNIRHHVLIVGVPITMILYASNLTRGYASEIRTWIFDWPYLPDLILGAAALGIFIIAPVLMRHIWTTEPLADGPLRRRLDGLCTRIGLRCRDILVWNTDGMVVNAAVMGLLPRVRYVLLSDALLETMSDEQVEAVFGHESGHVRLHHIEFFLLFAFVTMLSVSGAMQGLLELWPRMSLMTIQIIGAGITLMLWGVGFGWISRRFERQADLFGAICVTPEPAGCKMPCSVHPQPRGPDGAVLPESREPSRSDSSGVCATAAASFVSALDRVAVLNGIPHEERSWRHSSIGSRIRFLTSLADDPQRLARFDRVVRRIKTTLLVLAVVGTALAVYYYSV